MPKYQYTAKDAAGKKKKGQLMAACLLYTSPSPRDTR